MVRLSIISLVLSLSTPVFAASVFLNGVNIDGVTNQKFQNCNVEIDQFGNVKIMAKGFAVNKGGGGAAAQSGSSNARVGGPATQRYWLVTEKAARV